MDPSLERLTRAIERLSKLDPCQEDLYGIIGRLLRLPGAVVLLEEAIREIER